MAKTSRPRRKLSDAAEMTFVGRNPLRRKWLLKLTRALIDRGGAGGELQWQEKLRAARRGFFPASYVLYNLSANGHRDYVSDFQRETRTRGQAFSRTLNGQAWALLRDKVAFYFLCRELGIPTPELLAVIKQGTPHRLGNHAGPTSWTALQSLVDERGCVVVKPANGSFGEGLRFVQRSRDRYLVNGKESDWAGVEEVLRTLDYFLVSEYVTQGTYSSSIFPGATNSIGLLTVHRSHSDGPHLAGAIQRFGRMHSVPMDAFRRGRGGLSAAIDASSGVLGRAACLGDRGELLWHSSHPDTGAVIEGVTVPEWDRIRECVLDAADKLSFLPYVRWDVIATDDGCTLLEGNDSPGIDSMQVHAPLLQDPEVRAFFEEHDVVSRSANVGSSR